MAQNAFGTIYIKHQKGSYTPGDQVNGFVLLNLVSPVPGPTEIIVSITGTEETFLIERWTRTYEVGEGENKRTETEEYFVDHHQVNFVLNKTFEIFKFKENIVPPGQYSFPMTFLLPRGLPSTVNIDFKHNGDCYAKVNYTIGARLNINMKRCPPISSSQDFIINQEPLINPKGKVISVKDDVSWCWWFSKGTAEIRTYFEKNEYESGETAVLITEANNSQWTVDISSVEALFVQNVHATAKGYSHSFERIISLYRHKGIKAGELIVGENARKFNIILKDGGTFIESSCDGKLVRNSYQIVNKIKMDLSCRWWNTNPKSRITVNIRNPDFLNYKKWEDEPVNWDPKTMEIYRVHLSS